MFGEYQPEIRIHPSIWLGQKHDAAGNAPVCIKVISVPERDERDTVPAQKFLIAAAVQQAIAEHSVRWAPVLKLGSDGVDSFYVTHQFPRSLQTLIERKTKVTAQQLRTIMLEIVEALVDLEHTYNLAHGNLKASNVFLTSAYEINEYSIRLGDPDPDADAVPALKRSADVKSMGQILYSLATIDDHANALVPLTNFQPWKHLGPSARKWFELCNQMLDSPDRPGLEQLTGLRTQITQIRTPRRGTLMSMFSF